MNVDVLLSDLQDWRQFMIEEAREHDHNDVSYSSGYADGIRYAVENMARYLNAGYMTVRPLLDEYTLIPEKKSGHLSDNDFLGVDDL